MPLPLAIVPLAIGTPSAGDTGAGWAFALYLVAPAGAVLIAIGVGAPRLVTQRAR